MFLFRTIDPNMGGWKVYKHVIWQWLILSQKRYKGRYRHTPVFKSDLTIFTCSSVCHKRDIPLEGEEKDLTEETNLPAQWSHIEAKKASFCFISWQYRLFHSGSRPVDLAASCKSEPPSYPPCPPQLFSPEPGLHLLRLLSWRELMRKPRLRGRKLWQGKTNGPYECAWNL